MELATEQQEPSLNEKLSELEDLNDDEEDWATSLQNLEKNYDIFYSEQVTNVNIYFFAHLISLILSAAKVHYHIQDN